METTTPDATELTAASRGLLGIVVRSMAPALEHVTVPQFRLIMLVVTNGPTRSGLLAEQLAVETSTLTRNVDRLIAGGWVERERNRTNRREVFVQATTRGRALARVVNARRSAELSRVLGALSEDDKSLLVHAASVFRRTVGEPSPQEVSLFGP